MQKLRKNAEEDQEPLSMTLKQNQEKREEEDDQLELFLIQKKMYESKDPAYVRRYYEQVKGAVKVCDICGLSCTESYEKT